MKTSQAVMPAITGLVLYALGMQNGDVLGFVGIALGLYQLLGALLIAWAVTWNKNL